MTSDVQGAIDALANERGFSGVVSVDRGGDVEFAKAYGLAHRSYDIANTVDTRFAIASGGKGLTALAVVSLVDDGTLQMSTTARSLLGSDLPLIDDAVTVEHLLAHTSGIGDYLDEDGDGDGDGEVTDYPPVAVHRLVETEQFLPWLDGYPTKFPPGERFAYCNGGFMVLALIAERASGVPFHDLVRQRVCAPAGLLDTDFFRSDELPERTATGYLPIDGVSRTNVFHLPVLGNGDGGIYSTVADVSTFWRALFAGTIVPTDWVAEMVKPRNEVPADSMRYGLGFWLHESTDAVILIGGDAGVSFRSVHSPGAALTYTVISNTTAGAWPITRRLDDLVDG